MQRRANKKIPPKLDSCLPLPEGTGLPPLKQDGGREHLEQTHPVKMVELSWRAFYVLWEQAEIRAQQNYPKYVGGPMDNVAQAWLEATHAFRSSFRDQVLPIMPEEKAREARQLRTELEKAAKTRKNGGRASKAVSEPVVKPQRCREMYDTDRQSRCLGPENHKGLHRDKEGHRWAE